MIEELARDFGTVVQGSVVSTPKGEALVLQAIHSAGMIRGKWIYVVCDATPGGLGNRVLDA